MDANSTLVQLYKLKHLCRTLVENPKDVNSLKELRILIQYLPEALINIGQPIILSAFYPIFKSISEDRSSYTNQEKQLMIDILNSLFKKSIIKNVSLFFNIYSFLLFELYDHSQNKVLPICEENKLAIMECTTNLSKSLSSDVIFEVYAKENAPKLCQMIYAAIEVAKTERMRKLRIAAMECIMALARVLKDDDFADVVMRKHVSQVFLFFLPGLASGFKQIILDDEKVGYKIPKVALKAWGRIITLLLQDYNPPDNKFDIRTFKDNLGPDANSGPSNSSPKQKFNTDADIEDYLRNVKQDPQWYCEADKRLQTFAVEFMKLTYHSRYEVRLELTIMCQIVIDNCLTTIPKTVGNLIEIVIALGENEDGEVALHSKTILADISNKLSSDAFQSLLEQLEEGFFNGINRLPRQFNSVDEREQRAALNLLIGYISLFGNNKLSHVLLNGNHLQKLLNTLVHISKLECKNAGKIEEVSTNDFSLDYDEENWKVFHFFRYETVGKQLEKLCNLLGKYDTFKIVSDFLLDVLLYQIEHRKEAIFLLNEVLQGHHYLQENEAIIKDILNVYMDDSYWNAPLSVSTDENGHRHNLNEVHSNVIQVCLLNEGIGKIALMLRKDFDRYKLKLLYMVMEKAGQNNSYVRSASLCALNYITFSCGFKNIPTLINENMDYFSFHIERKLHKENDIENVLHVLTMVLKYSSQKVLTQLSSILEEVLVQSCDRFKGAYAMEYFKVFKTFIECVWRWHNIKINLEPVKSRAKQLEEMETFKVTGAKTESNCDFSDDIMNKSAQELFSEDMEKKSEDVNMEIDEPEVEEYKKPDPPTHIKITLAILKTSLNFLPSKDRQRKLAVLDILNSGLEVIKSWEDELLPIVHQIWSPLVERFKEYQDPLIINYSVQLLLTLARHSKDFIRMRTIKEVLPSITKSLEIFSVESYLKDRGSAYRYSQGYKLQITILDHLGKILAYLNVPEENLATVSEAVFHYFSEKQSRLLQESALQLFLDVALFDYNFMRNLAEIWLKKHESGEFSVNIKVLNMSIQKMPIT